MAKTEKERQHKKRHRRRTKDQRQQILQETLAKIPPLSSLASSAFPNSSMAISSSAAKEDKCVTQVFDPIPAFSLPDFWSNVPDTCHPQKAVMDYDTWTSLDPSKRARDERFQAKRLRKEMLRMAPTSKSEDDDEIATDIGLNNPSKRKSNNRIMLNEKRGQRKAWQVENFVTLLKGSLSAVKGQGKTVVDFGSGSGNLCLALAAYFPNTRFILVDKNVHSLELVKKRVEAANLKNVYTQQFSFTPENLHEYQPPQYTDRGNDSSSFAGDNTSGRLFDIGIGLHCCGSFTDMVMELCLRNKADCIVCPCCNGGMTSEVTGGYCYPRSDFLKQCMTQEEYLLNLSKAADNNQHYTAKCWIEFDRALWAKAQGLDVELWKMTPTECTPKHHVLYLKVPSPSPPQRSLN